MMEHDIREAVLHLDPLRSVVKTELIQRDGTCIVKHIPGDALVDELKAHTRIAPMHTGCFRRASLRLQPIRTAGT